MPRSTLYVSLLKKLIDASKQKNPDLFYKMVEEIYRHVDELSVEERFDLEMNIKSEIKSFEESLEEIANDKER